MEELPAFEPGAALPGAEELPPGGMEEFPAAGGAAPGEEETTLLATPGKRDRDFKWVNPDKRKQDRRKTTGPRIKSYRRMVTPEATTGKTTRSTHPGYSDLSLFSKGIYTEDGSNYEEEQVLQEQRILSIDYETQRLIKDLDKLEQKVDEA